jgi:AraC-like DNA-binding protein
VQRGEAVVCEGDTPIKLIANQLYFINGYKLTSQYCIDSMSVEWLHFITDSVYLNYFRNSIPLVIPLDISVFASFIPVFTKLKTYFEHSELEDKVITMEIQSLIHFALARVLEISDINDLEISADYTKLLPALEYINTHFSSNISLDVLAGKCCLSSNYFQRIFKRNFGITPFNYMLKMKMEKAIRLLIYTDFPVKQIAFTVGFEDEAYFSRMFSKIYNESPGRYRKINLKHLP